MRFRIIISLAAAVAVAALWGFGLPSRERSHDKPDLGAQNPTSIDLLIAGEKVAVITNTENLLSLMRAGRTTPKHMCSIPGRMFLHYAQGTIEEVDILPGHTGTNFEFICTNGYFAVPRGAFLSSLAIAGVDTNKVPTPPK